MGQEQVGVLELRCVAGVRVDDQLRIRDVLRKRERIDGRNHHVPISVYHQRRLRDGLEFRKAFSSQLPPFGERRDLRLHRLQGTRWIGILFAKMTSFPERSAGGLATRRWRKEQIEEVFEGVYGVRGVLHDL